MFPDSLAVWLPPATTPSARTPRPLLLYHTYTYAHTEPVYRVVANALAAGDIIFVCKIYLVVAYAAARCASSAPGPRRRDRYYRLKSINPNTVRSLMVMPGGAVGLEEGCVRIGAALARCRRCSWARQQRRPGQRLVEIISGLRRRIGGASRHRDVDEGVTGACGMKAPASSRGHAQVVVVQQGGAGAMYSGVAAYCSMRVSIRLNQRSGELHVVRVMAPPYSAGRWQGQVTV